MLTLRSHLCGRWEAGTSAPSALHDPTTAQVVAQTSTAGLDLRRALAYARDEGGPALRAMTFAERGSMLEAFGAALHAQRDPLIEASILNGGTPRSDAKFDIDGAVATLSYYAGVGKALGDRKFLVEGEGEALTRSPRFWGHHVRTPLRGVAVHVNAFNFPAWGLAEKAAVALLAGMPVVSKPATSTALLAFRVMEHTVASGALPPGALSLVCGGAGDMLQDLGGQDVLAFTGSGATGTLLRSLENVVGRSVRVNVEADSLNACVLGEDVEVGSETWQMFIRDTAREITQKSGQKCTATRRIFVPRARVESVLDALAEQVFAVKIGNPALQEVRMGPLSTEQQRRDVRAGIARLVEGGARVVHGDPRKVEVIGADPEQGYFVGPVLLRADAPRDADVVHEHEVFGPVATVMPHDGAKDAVALVALGEGGLVSSVYTDDREVLGDYVLGMAPYSGRVLVGSKKVADQATAPGLVLPSCVHGGPGRAGGGEELGGERGLSFYMQRTAIQGDRALLDRLLRLDAKG